MHCLNIFFYQVSFFFGKKLAIDDCLRFSISVEEDGKKVDANELEEETDGVVVEVEVI